MQPAPGPPAGVSQFTASVDLPVSIEQAFAYHERPGCLNRLIPPWESVRLEHSDNSLQPGSRVVLKTSIAGVPVRWHARHTVYEPPHLFADIQDSGPFAYWHHRHRFESLGEPSSEDQTQSRLTDDVQYQLPGGVLGKKFGSGFANSKLQSMFAYRHRVTRDDLTLIAKYPTKPLCIAVSGATGLVGSSLCDLFRLLGHRVMSITRGSPKQPDGSNAAASKDSQDTIAAWSDDAEFSKFNQVDVIVHLAGKPIAGERWTESAKREMRDSRVIKTRELCQRLAKLDTPPDTLICASATGFYGDRGDEILNETSAHGDDFLASVGEQWEDACTSAQDAGIRVVNTRFGIVLSPQGGALQKMLLPAKWMGGKLGSGDQYWSWIGLDDVLGGIVHAIHTTELSGPVNFVSPTPIKNRDFASTLGRVIGRPALFPAPAIAMRLALGEMADALLLASTRVVPDRLLSTGYQFRFTSLDELLRYNLGKAKLS
ncbi:TIGR01777 family oxidoreductase [Neorhodopirellula lusitana]|uniref:TIGR01777 family oxidoreductase n=1 Tax=Neorhodopirellula lusitana TaxID=445327 RepID=UPI00384D00EE